ncbi:DUF397 domain-containing protein [Sphaerisporangium siamense]|uniref:Putative secreted Zn-dependent protease n=1 Tax=Sphaerisporangium siamense TaxID=795645 RepID=A0A7W7DF31_9ACTN|nr:DUF397 domain-containing protein [Sphaerisporangium siamense]MBB4705705.1 putative secreted Zn-dependent protease [Sphaerisporangium siamense]
MRFSSTAYFPAVEWRTAARCTTKNCVEVAIVDGLIAVRDSKDPANPALLYTESEWQVFIDGAKNGEFDVQSLKRPSGEN